MSIQKIQVQDIPEYRFEEMRAQCSDEDGHVDEDKMLKRIELYIEDRYQLDLGLSQMKISRL